MTNLLEIYYNETWLDQYPHMPPYEQCPADQLEEIEGSWDYAKWKIIYTRENA